MAKFLNNVVARDGIEPPTPAFSGLRSTSELPGHGTPARSTPTLLVRFTLDWDGSPADAGRDCLRVELNDYINRTRFPQRRARRVVAKTLAYARLKKNKARLRGPWN